MIEDDAIHIKLIKRALERSGYSDNLVCLEDGEKAIEYLFPDETGNAPPCPRFILLDINLPKINGIQVLKRIKSDIRLRPVPVVMLTTSNNHIDMEECLRNSANSYITKPLDYENFMEKMKSVVRYWLEVNDMPEE